MPVGTSQRPHSNLSLIAAAALLFCGHPHICKLHHASAYTGELPPNFRFSLLLVILLLWQALALLMGFNHGSPFFPCGDIIAHLSAIYYPFPVVFCQTHDFVLKKKDAIFVPWLRSYSREMLRNFSSTPTIRSTAAHSAAPSTAPPSLSTQPITGSFTVQ